MNEHTSKTLSNVGFVKVLNKDKQEVFINPGELIIDEVPLKAILVDLVKQNKILLESNTRLQEENGIIKEENNEIKKMLQEMNNKIQEVISFSEEN